MLEKLADHDDELMEQLLEDIPPPRDKVFDDLAKELRERRDVPGADRRRDAQQRRAAAAEGAAPRSARHRRDDCARLGVTPNGDAVAYVLKTAAHGAWRQAVDRPRAGRGDRRWRDARHAGAARPAASPACSS